MDNYEGAYEKLKDIETKKEDVDLDDFEEFMRKVEEVNKMVHALASGDKVQVDEATRSADSWLKNQNKMKSSHKETKEEIIHDPSAGMKTKREINKTVINEKAFKDEKSNNENQDLDHLTNPTMSQEAFMKSVEEDAKKRSEDRKRRIKDSDAIKAEGNKAFRNGDYEKALDSFNKAIDIRRDSCVLYTNRALTLLNLGLYTKALKDCETALKLNENNFKARLYQGKAYFEMGEEEKAKECMKETREMFPEKLDTIEDYEKSWTADSCNNV